MLNQLSEYETSVFMLIMSVWTAFLFVSIVLMTPAANAQELYQDTEKLLPEFESDSKWSVKFKDHSDNSQNRLFNMNGRSIQLSWQPSQDSLYYYMSSYSGTVVTVTPAYKLSAKTFGFGKSHAVTDGFNVFAQTGYIITKPSFGGRHKCEPHYCEGLYYGTLDGWAHIIDLSGLTINEYDVTTSHGFNFAAGGELTHKISKNSKITFGLEFMRMSFKTSILVMAEELNYNVTGQRIENYYDGTTSKNIYFGYELIF